jgi:hypothetical protein
LPLTISKPAGGGGQQDGGAMGVPPLEKGAWHLNYPLSCLSLPPSYI